MHATRSKLFLFMQYCDGGDLEQRLNGHKKNGTYVHESPMLDWFVQMALALQYLHADNIIFRGLVPDNLLIDQKGYVKLVDFGFAKKVPLDPDGNAGNTYTLCGTAEYLAPEIVNSKGHGKGADWWALGVVIYEMLAGYPPFFAQNPFEIYQAILKASASYPAHFDVNLYEGIVPATGAPAVVEATGGTAPRTGLLPRLLQADRNKRIGCLKNGAEK